MDPVLECFQKVKASCRNKVDEAIAKSNDLWSEISEKVGESRTGAAIRGADYTLNKKW